MSDLVNPHAVQQREAWQFDLREVGKLSRLMYYKLETG